MKRKIPYTVLIVAVTFALTLMAFSSEEKHVDEDLRDRIAIEAMHGILCDEGWSIANSGDEAWLAERAYTIADYMLKEKKQWNGKWNIRH